MRDDQKEEFKPLIINKMTEILRAHYRIDMNSYEVELTDSYYPDEPHVMFINWKSKFDNKLKLTIEEIYISNTGEILDKSHPTFNDPVDLKLYRNFTK